MIGSRVEINELALSRGVMTTAKCIVGTIQRDGGHYWAILFDGGKLTKDIHKDYVNILEQADAS